MPQSEKSRQQNPIYTSTSMLRVFSPGDLVEVNDTVPFDALRVGDIIVFPSQDNPEKRIVHRIIGKSGDALTTMGDNNFSPDKAPVIAAQEPLLVVARIRPDGRRLPISRGTLGILQFRVNRCRYWAAWAVRRVGLLLEPLMFWRIRLTETRQFGDSTFYYAGSRAIAKKTENGARFLKQYWRLIYKIQ